MRFLFIFSLLSGYIYLEYVRIHIIYRVHQAEYVIHILVVAPQEDVNMYSTLKPVTLALTIHTLLLCSQACRQTPPSSHARDPLTYYSHPRALFTGVPPNTAIVACPYCNTHNRVPGA